MGEVEGVKNSAGPPNDFGKILRGTRIDGDPFFILVIRILQSARVSMKLKLFIVFLIGLALILGALFFLRKEDRTPLMNLVEKIEKEKDAGKRKELTGALGKLVPNKGIEFKQMSASKDADVRKALLVSIAGAKRFNPAWVNLVDENPDDLKLIEVVATAIMNLKDRGDVSALIELAEDRVGSAKPADGFLVEAAIGALAEIKDERAIEVLLKRREFFFLHGGSSPIAKFGARVLPRLVEIAQNKEDKRNRDAAAAIRMVNDPVAIPAMVDLVNQSKYSSEIRVSAVRALDLMQAKEAVPMIEKLLEDKDSGVQVQVAEMLIKSGNEMQREKVVERLSAKTGAYFKSMTLMNLRQNSDIKHGDAVQRLLDDEAPDVRQEVILYLANADYEKYLPRILETLNDQSWSVREETLKLLRDKKEMRAAPYAEKLLEDNNDWVRFEAAMLLKASTGKSCSYRETAITRALEEGEKYRNHHEK